MEPCDFMNSKRLRIIKNFSVVILWMAAAVSIFNYYSVNSVYAADLISLILLTAIVPLLGLVPFSIYDCFLMCPMLVLSITVLKLPRFSNSLLLLIYMSLICVIVSVKTRKVCAHGIGVFLNLLIGGVLLSAYNGFIYKVLPLYYQIAWKNRWHFVGKTIFLIVTGAIFISVFVLFLMLLNRIFSRWRDIFDTVTEKFHDMEFYVVLLAGFTLLCLTLMHFLIPHDDGSIIYKYYIVRIKYAFAIILFAVEVIYVCLLLRTVSIRDKMKAAENDKNTAKAYNSELETSLDNLREVRHDVKNLFLTMGAFVEQSGNPEMKQFYESNIVPFVQDSIIRSEIQDKLKILLDDSLKSFFYFKLCEKTSAGIKVLLEVESPLAVGIGSGDFVRVLGNLIDNAAEEAALSNRQIGLKITEDANAVTVRVSNGVRDEVRLRGVSAGTTDKGLGRGKGLLIAEKIIGRYKNVVLNSYFTDTEFVQSLIIGK